MVRGDVNRRSQWDISQPRRYYVWWGYEDGIAQQRLLVGSIFGAPVKPMARLAANVCRKFTTVSGNRRVRRDSRFDRIIDCP